MNRNSGSKRVDDITKLPLEERIKLADKYKAETNGLYPLVIQKDSKSSLKAYDKPKM